MTDARLARVEKLLIEVGGLWADENEYLVTRADELRRDIEEFRKEVPAQVESLIQERADRAADDLEAQGATS